MEPTFNSSESMAPPGAAADRDPGFRPPPTLGSMKTPGLGLSRTLVVAGGLGGITILALAVALIGGVGEPSHGASTSSSAGATSAATVPATLATQDAPPAAGPSTHEPTPYPAIEPAPKAPSTTHAALGGGATVADRSQASTSPVAERETCLSCGTVVAVHPVTVTQPTTGVGAVAGGATGALVGSQVAGRHDRTVGGLIGAIGGAFLGNHIEKQVHKTTAYDVKVKMDDGSTRTVRETHTLRVGTKVDVQGHALKPRAQVQGA